MWWHTKLLLIATHPCTALATASTCSDTCCFMGTAAAMCVNKGVIDTCYHGLGKHYNKNLNCENGIAMLQRIIVSIVLLAPENKANHTRLDRRRHVTNNLAQPGCHKQCLGSGIRAARLCIGHRRRKPRFAVLGLLQARRANYRPVVWHTLHGAWCVKTFATCTIPACR